jgi:serine/threonine protein kinase
VLSRPSANDSKRSKYRILGLVGQGQFGRVYAAVHRQSQRIVALKSLDHSRFPTHKFLRELRVLLTLQHPNIATCESLEHTPTGRYLVMDYCEGGTLRNLMMDSQQLHLSHRLKLIMDILSGLEHAHREGVVHCDIKPENILLSCTPEGWTAKVTDFGIARFRRESRLQSSGITGSPAYMAPERFYGQYSHTSDLYAVGVLLFEILAGHRPFSGTPADLMSAHMNVTVKFPDTVSESLHAIIRRSLEKLSARRYSSATEMLRAIQAIATLPEFSLPNSTIPLLSPTTYAPVPFEFQSQQGLQSAITQLETFIPDGTIPDRTVPDGTIPDGTKSERAIAYFCRVEPQQILLTRHAVSSPPNQPPSPSQNQSSQNKLTDSPTEMKVAIAEPIHALFPRTQGCFVQTARSLILIPIHRHNPDAFMPQVIAPLPSETTIAVATDGHWAAYWTEAGLRVQALSERGQHWSLGSGAMAHPVAPATVQVLALNNRHIALIADSGNSSGNGSGNSPESCGTKVQIFNRRGNAIGTLKLPIRIGKVIQMALPYRLLAIEQGISQSIVVIDLQPYRMMRFGVSIQPEWMAALPWGVVLANRSGQLVILDHTGQEMAQVKGPEHLTAIAALDHHQILTATWDGQQGSLYRSNLRSLGLDVLNPPPLKRRGIPPNL